MSYLDALRGSPRNFQEMAARLSAGLKSSGAYQSSTQPQRPEQSMVSQMAYQANNDPNFAAKAAADRQSAATSQWADINNPNVPAWKKLGAVWGWLVNSGVMQGAQTNDEAAYQAIMRLPEDVRQAFIQSRIDPVAFWKASGAPQQLVDHYVNNPQLLGPQFIPSWLRRAAGLSPSSGYGTNPTDNLPPGGSLNIYDPGKWLAQMLRGQLPGYVMNTKVPRPKDISLQNYMKLDPTQKQVLAAYWEALGIPPESAIAEMTSYWLSGPQRSTPNIRWAG